MAVNVSLDASGAKRALAAFEEALAACREAEAVAALAASDAETYWAARPAELAAARQNLDDWQRTRAALERLHAAITAGEPT